MVSTLPTGLFCRSRAGGLRNPENLLLRKEKEPLQAWEVARIIPVGDGTAVVVPKWGRDLILPLKVLRENGIIPA